MKSPKLLLLWVVTLGIMSSCSSPKKLVLDSPEATFSIMVAAIQAKDLDTYTKCWFPEKAENEGLVSVLRQEPSTWDGLQKLFLPSSKIVDRSESTEDGKLVANYEVVTDGIENGEHINAVSMIQEGSEWKMYHW